MDKTVCELFAGVGGFRCGLNNISTLNDIKKTEKWNTVWYSQWEPSEKAQYAHGCYAYHFGSTLDKENKDTTNISIEDVNKKSLPDFNLLVGGFPCQDYSVASSLANSKGLEGKKGVLWWSIREILEEKQPAFVLLENVDRLLKSPVRQRGRDFGVILSCFYELGYTVEWRVLNAAEYGYQQRRKRVFIFAHHNTTQYNETQRTVVGYDLHSSTESKSLSLKKTLLSEGFFAKTFPNQENEKSSITTKFLPATLGELSEEFVFLFENTGVMKDGVIFSMKTSSTYSDKIKTLGEIVEKDNIDSSHFIPEERLYYTNIEVNHSDESMNKLPKEARNTWQYLKGAKKLKRIAKSGYEYIFSEGPIPMIDEYSKPARTLLTSEGNFSRTTHIIRDFQTGKIRLLTPLETEKIQGFPENHTKYYLNNNQVKEVPVHKRRFMMGNALVVDLIKDMEKTLSDIFEKEGIK